MAPEQSRKVYRDQPADRRLMRKFAIEWTPDGRFLAVVTTKESAS